MLRKRWWRWFRSGDVIGCPYFRRFATTNDQLYGLLTNWVENGVPPERVEISSAPTATAPAKSRPLCVYPQKPAYTSGDPKVAANYTCS